MATSTLASSRGLTTSRCSAAPSASGVFRAPAGGAGRRGQRVPMAATAPRSSGGDARPDWVDTHCLDQAGPGPSRDLDAEWQAFIAANARQPPPLIWSADSLRPSGSSNWTGSSSSGGAGPASTSNRGTTASSSGRIASSIQSFDDWDFADDDMAVPAPCNLPVNEAHQRGSSSAAAAAAASIPSASAPSAAASEQQQQQLWPTLLPHGGAARELCSPSDLLARGGLLQSLREVYVLLFGVGQKDTEGIYSLRAVSDDGLPTETIIAFENMEDAVRYSGLLEATMEHSPYVCSIPPSELMSFCADSGYRCRLELEGSLLMPPDYNVTCTDWERSLRLREGKFYVLPEEPDYIHAASSSNTDAASPWTQAGTGSSGSSGQLLLRHSNEQQFTAAQLNTLKAQLEALLPDDSSCDEEDEDDEQGLYHFGI